MFLVNQAMVDLNVGTAGLVALLGYAVVFVGLIALMVVVSKIMVAKKSKAAAPEAAAPAPAAAPKPVLAAAAPGTAGEVKLFDVADKEAAMLMAIVANKLGKPLNELRFKSIKEVK